MTPWTLTIENGAKVKGFELASWEDVLATAGAFLDRLLKPAEAALAKQMLAGTDPMARGLTAIGVAGWRLRVCAPLHLDTPFQAGDKLFEQAQQ